MLGILAFMAAGVVAFGWIGDQRLHNTALWQRWHPVTAVSPAQTSTLLEVKDTRRIGHVVLQTEKGLYFLTGARYVPADGSQVVVQTNARWDLFLCAADGTRCMTIHSFCAGASGPKLNRDESGRMEGCHAPRISDEPLPTISSAPPLTAVPGGMGKRRPPPPAVGLSHPREWASLMGLPVAATK